MFRDKVVQAIVGLALAALNTVGCSTPTTPNIIIVTATPNKPPTPTRRPWTPTPVPITATFTYADGNTIRLSDLHAQYENRDLLFPGLHPRIEDLLSILITEEKTQGVEISRFITVPLASVRRIINQDMSSARCLSKSMRVEKRDGSVILISSSVLEEKDALGAQTRMFKGNIRLASGETPGYAFTFMGFSGWTKWESGSRSTRLVQDCETRIVEFE